MGVVNDIRSEVADLKLKGLYPDAEVSSADCRIIELLERQATIIEILGEIDPAYLKRLRVESYNPQSAG